ncbi:MAG: class I SAM-dependent methyltransferase [Planctomycetaceae bacterium]|nr:class I SAM-dependent methyltransferase [Planctomycetaceae bacterium]
MTNIVREFHRHYYDAACSGNYGQGLHSQTLYHGIETHKCPLDLWIFQEILTEVQPGLVIELGTYLGGSTLFVAHQLQLHGRGMIVSIDNRELPRPSHNQIRYLTGLTTAPNIVEAVSESIATIGDQPVLVIHDADHRYDQVLADLETYSPFVTPGSYLIVEDTHVNGHPVLNGWGPGPFEAVQEFCKLNPEFQPDRSREKFFITYNPCGYLRRSLSEPASA